MIAEAWFILQSMGISRAPDTGIMELPRARVQNRLTQTLHQSGAATPDHSGRRALLLGFGMFVLLWILSIPYRAGYMPDGRDIPALADGLLLAPGAHWQEWFTRGYSDFWDSYPEWPLGATEFTRPAFQFLIYIAHFTLGKDWASYQVINCFAAAGLAAMAFQIAQTALGLRTGLSVLTAILVVSSPPVLQSWVFGLAFAIEPVATLFVASAFLAVFARRDFLCLMFLFAALLTKENAVWAPLAAAITIMLRPKPGEPAPSPGVCCGGYVLAGSSLAQPSFCLLRRHWRHVRNVRLQAACGLPKLNFPQAERSASSVCKSPLFRHGGRFLGPDRPSIFHRGIPSGLRVAVALGTSHYARDGEAGGVCHARRPLAHG